MDKNEWSGALMFTRFIHPLFKKKVSNIALMDDLPFRRRYQAPKKCFEGTPLKRKYLMSEKVYFGHSDNHSAILFSGGDAILTRSFTQFSMRKPEPHLGIFYFQKG